MALPVLVLAAYAYFIVDTYWLYLDLQLQLRSPEFAALPEDVIGFGFWSWWPIIAPLFAGSLLVAVWHVRRWLAAASLIAVFVVLGVTDYLLCERLIQALLGA
jgi:hypothetical protein